MTVVAVVTTGDVIDVFARCSNAVMAAAAIAQYLRMINCDHRFPDRGGVAVLADICCQGMQRTFAGCISPVMAARTIGHDVGMVEVGRHPGNCRMAVITDIPCSNVTRMLALSSCTVMAVAAAAYYLGMVDKRNRFPAGRAVTIFANIRGLNVHWALARRIHAVVATNAIANNAAVIEHSRNPGSRVMAIVALIARGHVIK